MKKLIFNLLIVLGLISQAYSSHFQKERKKNMTEQSLTISHKNKSISPIKKKKKKEKNKLPWKNILTEEELKKLMESSYVPPSKKIYKIDDEHDVITFKNK